MKRFFKIIFLFVIFFLPSISFAEENFEASKQEIIVLYNANKLKEAYQLISNIPEDKRDSEIWMIAANITQDYGRDLDAIFLLEKAINTDSTNYKLYYNLGNLYLKDKKYHSAITNYKLALKYKKDFSYAWYNTGCAYLAVEEYSKAKKSFEKAILYNNQEPNFYYNIAYVYKKMNNRKQADKALNIYNALIEQRN